MANSWRLRPAAIVFPEYLENPFPEAGTEIHAPPVPFRLCLSFPVPSPPALSPAVCTLPAMPWTIKMDFRLVKSS